MASLSAGSNNTLSGSASNDTLNALGYSGVTLVGGGGADLFYGGPSGSLVGGTGNDTFYDTVVGGGSDTIVGGAGTNTYFVNSTTDKITDTGTGSVISSSVGFDLSSSLLSGVNNLLYTGAGSVSLLGNSLANTVDASAATGAVTLNGGAGADTMIGSSLNDTLIGNGSDSLYGGAGANTYIVSSATDTISDNGTGSLIRSSVGFDLSSTNVSGVNNLLYTGTGSVSLLGNTLANSITGGVGNDTLSDGGGGNDTLIGGGGKNTYLVSSSGVRIQSSTTVGSQDTSPGSQILTSTSFDLSSSNAGGIHVLTYDTFRGDTLRDPSVDVVSLNGSSIADTLSDGGGALVSMAGGGGTNTYYVNDATDTLTDGGSNGVVISSVALDLSNALQVTNLHKLIYTGSGGVVLSGTTLSDTIVATLSGGNTLSDGGGSQADSLVGGVGNNLYVVSTASDTISDSGTGSTIQTKLGSYNLGSGKVSGVGNLTYAGSSNAILTGIASLAGSISGGAGNDLLSDGGATHSTLIGGGGSDAYVVSNASDLIVDGGGGVIKSSVSYDLGSSLAGGITSLVYTSSIGGVLTADTNTANADSILGGTGSDTLYGYGSDTLNGGGGANPNTYIVNNTTDRINETVRGSKIISSVSYDLTSTLLSGSGVTNLIYTDSVNGGSLTGNGSSSLLASQANDTLIGKVNDTLNGGGGSNLYLVNGANVSVVDSGSGSIIQTTLGSYNLGSGKVSGVGNLTYSGSGTATLTGTGSQAGSITGGTGNDSLSDGGATQSTLVGGGGSDTYVVSNANDQIVDAGGGGSVIQSAVTYDLGSSLAGGISNLVYTGASGATLKGNATLSNSITGGGGNDTLYGYGSDTLNGQGGSNTYVVSGTGNVITDSGSGSVIRSSASFDLNSSLVSGVSNLIYTDSVNGGSLTGNGSSSLLATAANDTLIGQVNDTLNGGGGANLYIVNDSGVFVIDSGTGSVIATTLSNYDLTSTQVSGVSNLHYLGTDNAVLSGNTLGGSIIGGAGNDSLADGGATQSTLVGGGGSDTYVVSHSNDLIVDAGGAGSVIQSAVSYDLGSSLAGGISNLVYTGTPSATLKGNATLSNSITGGGGDDTLFGFGSDTLSGEAGSNTYVVSGTGNVISDSGSGSVIRSAASFDLNSSLVSGVSNLFYTGNAAVSLIGNSSSGSISAGAGNDFISDGSWGSAVSTLIGGGGADTFSVSNSSDSIVSSSVSSEVLSSVSFDLSATNAGTLIFSGSGSPGVSLLGNTLANSIQGGTGNDTLGDGGGGTSLDTLAGGLGKNTYLVSNPRDLIIDSGAYAEIYSGVGATLSGNSQSNLIDASGASGAVKLWGGSGGADTLIGGAYNDTLYATDYNAGNTLEGGAGSNTYYVYANNWDQIIDSGVGSVVHTTASFNLTTNATGVSNLVHDGTGAAVVLTGNSNAGSLIGSSTNDTCVGGGNDTMIGGVGANVYKVSSTTDTIVDHGHNSWIYSSVSYDLSNSLAGGVNNIGHYSGTAVSLRGNASANSIASYGEGDTLIGGGNDTLIGYGNGNVAYVVDSVANRIVGSYGRGTIYSSASYDLSNSLAGGINKLIYTGTAAVSLSGSTLSNLILGGAQGGDTLSDGGGGFDTLVGFGGNNYYLVSSSNDRVQESGAGSWISTTLGSYNLGNSLISGINNLIYTGRASALLMGNSAADSITGGSGNDTLVDSLSGGDTLSGRGGTNRYIVNNATDRIIDSGTGSVIQSSVGLNLGSSLISGVNNLIYTGSTGALLLGNSSADSITGSSGSDTLVDTLSGHDTLSGGGGTNRYIVNNATDRIIDSGTGSVIQSSVGLSLGSSLISGVNNLVYTGSGNTTLFGNSNANILDASAASSGVSLSGGAGKDTLLGGSGNDTLIGNGASSLVGGAGANTYVVSSAADSINDTGSGGVIRSSVGFSLGSSLVSGVNNLVYTGSGNVSLVGNSSANSITGGAGKDTIQGWFGTAASNTASDTLSGGAGSDSFILSAAGQTNNAYGNGTGAVAKITDFQGGSTGDKLVLHNFGTGHAGSAGYQTLSGGSGVLDVYSYQGTDSNQLVAHLTLASGTFSWSANASFV